MAKKKVEKKLMCPGLCVECVYSDWAECQTSYGVFCTANGYYIFENDEEDCDEFVSSLDRCCWNCQHCNQHTRGDRFEDFVVCKKPFAQVSTHFRSDVCDSWEMSDDRFDELLDENYGDISEVEFSATTYFGMSKEDVATLLQKKQRLIKEFKEREKNIKLGKKVKRKKDWRWENRHQVVIQRAD